MYCTYGWPLLLCAWFSFSRFGYIHFWKSRGDIVAIFKCCHFSYQPSPNLENCRSFLSHLTGAFSADGGRITSEWTSPTSMLQELWFRPWQQTWDTVTEMATLIFCWVPWTDIAATFSEKRDQLTKDETKSRYVELVQIYDIYFTLCGFVGIFFSPIAHSRATKNVAI